MGVCNNIERKKHDDNKKIGGNSNDKSLNNSPIKSKEDLNSK